MDELITCVAVKHLAARPSIADSEQDDSPPGFIHIREGTCVNDDQLFQADVLVEDGIIKEIGTGLNVPDSAKVINAKGMFIMPGGIDANTHMQLPFMNATSIDDFYTGTKAALAGGTTMIVDCVWDSPSTPLAESYDKWRDWADSKVACDYALSVGVTWWNEKVAADMELLVKDKGVNTFRVTQEYKDLYMLNDGELLQVLKKCKDLKAFVTVLAENGHVIEKKSEELISQGITGPEGHAMCRPEEIEAEAAHRVIVLANQARCPIGILPVTGRSAAKIISETRHKGYVVFGAPVTACLGTDGTHYWNKCWRHASAYVMVPPLRPDPTTSALLMGYLSSGDLQFTGSSHCTFNADQKALGCKDFRKIPHGVNGVEERMSIVWERGVNTGMMNACQFVAATSSNAAKILNIYPRKGRLAVGSDADIVVWDPHAVKILSAKTHSSASDFNIFEGTNVRGVPVVVIAGGKVAVDQNGTYAQRGWGKYIACHPDSTYVYGRVAARDEALAPQKVNREGDVPDTTPKHVPTADEDPPTPIGVQEEVLVATIVSNNFHHRPPTRSGGRHMQESSFSLSGEQFDDKVATRSSRGFNPPGGRSSALW
ncbi:dihydropyrimidinase-like [Watersipora subatra]|uniref:dihydropyrimidinase-like n=1 Tax=Watersipora subatra TaxID=2589382 RepID=UPI00355B1649